MTRVNPHLILGAGVAGLSAAFHLREPYRIFEATDEYGGVAGSLKIGGFLFDHAIHVLYTRDPYAEKLIRYLLHDNFQKHTRSSWVYSCGRYIQYPYQAHMYGLPDAVIKDNLEGLAVAIEGKNKVPPANFEEWIVSTFGPGIARNFMIPFNEKVWASDLRTMGFDWIADRVTVPDFNDVLEGSRTPSTTQYGPNAEFWYPRSGGMSALTTALAKQVRPVETGMRCVMIDLKHRQAYFEKGECYGYSTLISTLPLPRLISLLGEGVPDEIRDRAAALRSNRVITVNIGVARPNISNMHWVYLPDRDVEFHRISFPTNFSDSVAPPNTSSILVEYSESDTRTISRKDLIERTIATLIKLNILEPEDLVLCSNSFVIDPAYVIPNLDHKEAVKEILSWLRSVGIYSCGRFGTWEYLNMDHSLLSGKEAAEMATHANAVAVEF